MTKKLPRETRVEGILDAAVNEFVEKGYENTSMESIALRAGLTKGGLYHYFSGKDEVLIKANESFYEPVITLMNEAMAFEKAGQSLEFFIESYLTYWTEHPHLLSFIFLSMTKAMTNENLRHAYDGYTDRISSFYDSIYRKGVDSGEFQPMNTRNCSLALLAALDAVTGYLVIDHSLDLNSTIKSYKDMFIENFRKEEKNEADKKK